MRAREESNSCAVFLALRDIPCIIAFVSDVATETICERLLREEQESVAWSVVKPEREKPANARRKLRTADGHIWVRPTPDQYRYLRALETYPIERMARRRAQITPRQVKSWRKHEWFVEVETEAAREAADRLIESAWIAAMDGRLEPIYQQGQLLGYKRVHSEKLHIELLKGLMPEKFDRRAMQETTPSKTVKLATPEEIAAAVRRLSPTVGGATPPLPTLPE